MSRLLIALPLSLALFSACRKQKQVSPSAQAKSDTAYEEVSFAPIALPQSLASRLQPSYTRCQGKLKAHYQDKDQSLPFTLHFKTQRGVITTFTVTALLGVPVATGWIRKDSLFVDNRIGGSSIKEPLTRLTDMTGLPPDLAVVESVLTGRYVLPAGFKAVAATDSSFQAIPFPDGMRKLTALFSIGKTWPKDMSLNDPSGQYAIHNYEEGRNTEPGRTHLVQTDKIGNVLTTIRLEALSRKFE